MDQGPAKEVCFVVSPIGEPGSPIRKRADMLIEFLIEPAIGNNYQIIRADMIATPGSINRQVFAHLLNAPLVIADLTGHNPNVFYELAVRHAFARPYVQLIDSNERLPFDVFDQRTIKFDITDLYSVQACKVALAQHVAEVRRDGFKVETPIGDAIRFNNAEASASDGTKVLLTAIDQLQQQVAKLESAVASVAKKPRPMRDLLAEASALGYNEVHLRDPDVLAAHNVARTLTGT